MKRFFTTIVRHTDPALCSNKLGTALRGDKGAYFQACWALLQELDPADPSALNPPLRQRVPLYQSGMSHYVDALRATAVRLALLRQQREDRLVPLWTRLHALITHLHREHPADAFPLDLIFAPRTLALEEQALPQFFELLDGVRALDPVPETLQQLRGTLGALCRPLQPHDYASHQAALAAAAATIDAAWLGPAAAEQPNGELWRCDTGAVIGLRLARLAYCSLALDWNDAAQQYIAGLEAIRSQAGAQIAARQLDRAAVKVDMLARETE